MQQVTRLGLHQAGIGRADQGAKLDGREAELALAVGIEEQQGPAWFIKPLETQHTEARRHR